MSDLRTGCRADRVRSGRTGTFSSVDELARWCAFLGTWLVVAGAVHQGLLELRSEDQAIDRIRELRTQLPEPEHHSRWWWLLPPVAYWLEKRRHDDHRQQIVDAMTPEDQEVQARFIRKAAGWLYVATGGSLIAASETWALVGGHRAATPLFWVLVVVMPGLGIANAIRLQNRSDQEVVGAKGGGR